MSAGKALRALLADDGGATIVEYALIMALLSMVSIGALAGLGFVASQELQGDGNALTQAGMSPP